MKKHVKSLIYIIIILIFVLTIIAITPSMRSYMIMGAVSWLESFDVVGKSEGLNIQFVDPGSVQAEGLTWF